VAARFATMSSPRLSYETRLSAERTIFENQTIVHDLPRIHHHWANRYIRPKLEGFGFSTPNDLFYQTLQRTLGRSEGPLRFLSIGCGNCDLEVDLARRLTGDFMMECVDLNPAMLARGRSRASQYGVAGKLDFAAADLNSWVPAHAYDAVLANQFLHHVVNLEHLFDGIRTALRPGAPFVISDMIGRNGHRRWPEARVIVNEFWRRLPPSYRFNRVLNRFEERFEDCDCSVEGFEGIRSQDILPLLNRTFHFQFFFGFANVIDPFVDRQFGGHFDPGQAWVRRFIEEVHARDEAEQLAGTIQPTHMLAIVTKDTPAAATAFYPRPPRDCERDPERPMPESSEPRDGGFDCGDWLRTMPEAADAQFAFLSQALSASQQKALELAGWGENLRREFSERTAWALDRDRRVTELEAGRVGLERELEDRTSWALELDRLATQTAEQVRQLQAELASRTEWALTLDQRVRSLESDLAAECQRMNETERELKERTAWAFRLQDELEVARRVPPSRWRRLRAKLSRRR